INEQRKGVNIFIYGCPGTGKSQLSRVIAQEVDCNLFEVTREDHDGDPISGERRLRSVRTAQYAIEDKSALLLFDEVEDIFGMSDDMWGIQSPAQSHKGWLNQTLENNPIPTFWLTNSIDEIDAAFIRRFDMVIAENFERIHRSNLVGMGVIPFEFTGGDSRSSLGLTGEEEVTIEGLADVKPLQDVTATIKMADGSTKDITIKCRIDTAIEIEYIQHGGVLHYVLRDLAKAA
ncbi:MAG: AAA family ATPase, partial [Paracoccaceae bacterium]